MPTAEPTGPTTGPRPTVKCLVWDLDNTLWTGTLAEGDDVVPRPEAVELIRTLDRRGVLQSVASRNDPQTALAALHRFGLAEFFLCPQIGWGAKSESVAAVAAALNIGTGSLAFVDDEPYERAEVAFALPEVRCLDAADVAELADRPELTPEFVTAESAQRRQLYRVEQTRRAAEDAFDGPAERFLAGLGMRLRIQAAGVDDLRRAEELTVRTHQLNTTGRTYSYREVDRFRGSARHLLLTVRLTDRFGPYGTIGLVLVERASAEWTIRLLLLSCRVAARGLGSIVLTDLKRRAAAAGVRLLAEFVPTDRNRLMLATYKFNRFTEIGRGPGGVLLAADLTAVPADPPYVAVTTDYSGPPTPRPEPPDPRQGEDLP